MRQILLYNIILNILYIDSFVFVVLFHVFDAQKKEKFYVTVIYVYIVLFLTLS